MLAAIVTTALGKILFFFLAPWVSLWPAPRQVERLAMVPTNEDSLAELLENCPFDDRRVKHRYKPNEVIERYLNVMTSRPNGLSTYYLLELFRDYVHPWYTQPSYPTNEWIAALNQVKNHRDPMRKTAAQLLLSDIYFPKSDPMGHLATMESMEDEEDQPGFLDYVGAYIDAYVVNPHREKISDWYWEKIVRCGQDSPMLGLAFGLRLDIVLNDLTTGTCNDKALFVSLRAADPNFAHVVRLYELKHRYYEICRINSTSANRTLSEHIRQLFKSNAAEYYEYGLEGLTKANSFSDDPYAFGAIFFSLGGLDMQQLELVTSEIDRLRNPCRPLDEARFMIMNQLALSYEDAKRWDKALQVYTRVSQLADDGVRDTARESIKRVHQKSGLPVQGQ